MSNAPDVGALLASMPSDVTDTGTSSTSPVKYIRDKVREVVGRMESNQSASYKVPRNVTLTGAVAYTKKYALWAEKNASEKSEFYRYNQYYKLLPEWSDNLNQIVHLDLGCGPGLFAWVMHDHILENRPELANKIVFCGYDYAPNMIKLAENIRNELKDEFPHYARSEYFHQPEKLQARLRELQSPESLAIITCGYALIQVHDKPDAVEIFANTIYETATLIGRSVLLAVDACDTQQRKDVFSKAWRELLTRLKENGLDVKETQFPAGSIAHAQLGVKSQ